MGKAREIYSLPLRIRFHGNTRQRRKRHIHERSSGILLTQAFTRTTVHLSRRYAKPQSARAVPIPASINQLGTGFEMIARKGRDIALRVIMKTMVNVSAWSDTLSRETVSRTREIGLMDLSSDLDARYFQALLRGLGRIYILDDGEITIETVRSTILSASSQPRAGERRNSTLEAVTYIILYPIKLRVLRRTRSAAGEFEDPTRERRISRLVRRPPIPLLIPR